MTGSLTKRGNLDMEMYTEGKRCVNMKTVISLQAEGRLPGTDASLAALRRTQLCQHHDFRLPASRAVRQQNLVI